jgi:hypothetical protein
LLTISQAIKIINKIQKTDKLIKFKLLSGETYYESYPEINKRYPEQYEKTTLKVILTLLKSNKITNLDYIFLFNELLLCEKDLISKFKYHIFTKGIYCLKNIKSYTKIFFSFQNLESLLFLFYMVEVVSL